MLPELTAIKLDKNELQTENDKLDGFEHINIFI